jgi:hypothetical protein
MKFRKKPVEIDAWLIRELVADFDAIRMLPPHIVQGMSGNVLQFVSNGIHIRTLEGGMFGRLEDILIMGVMGEFYSCRPDVFEATYERVGDD